MVCRGARSVRHPAQCPARVAQRVGSSDRAAFGAVRRIGWAEAGHAVIDTLDGDGAEGALTERRGPLLKRFTAGVAAYRRGAQRDRWAAPILNQPRVANANPHPWVARQNTCRSDPSRQLPRWQGRPHADRKAASLVDDQA